MQTETLVEWDGKDFRGEQCQPFAIEFMKQNPKIFQWLRKRPKGVIHTACSSFRQFFAFIKMTPEEWLTKEPKEARNLAWDFIDTFVMEQPQKAITTKNFLKSFYSYHNDLTLSFDKARFEIVRIQKKTKYRMNNDVVWRIIQKTKTLRDQAILTMAFESGLRRNALANLTYQHYKNFMWFKLENDDVKQSNEFEGNIAIFKVVATKNKDFTYDKKLRRHGIWYYACIHKEGANALKRYVAEAHKNSVDETPFWINKYGGRLRDQDIFAMFKDCVGREDLPLDQITFHSLRRAFRHVVRNTSEITDSEFKESIMGHKLRGSQEAYFDKDPLEFAREYAKCNFAPSTLEKDRKIVEKDKEIQRLNKQIKEYEEAIEEAKATTKIEIQPLKKPSPAATREEINRAFNEFNESMSQSSTPSQIEAVSPTKVEEKPIVVEKPIETPISTSLEQPKEDVKTCPLYTAKDGLATKEDCDNCRTTQFRIWENCNNMRQKNPNSPIFQRTPKQKPE